MDKAYQGIIAVIMLTYLPLFQVSESLKTISEIQLKNLREEVRSMFYYAYNNYIRNAFPLDELRPLTCDGIDTWGSYSLTLIDSLDTLAILGNISEFERVVDIIIKNTNFNVNINVSVFETNIRIIGGLLSAHLLSHKMGISLNEEWPCSGPLLDLAEDLAIRLLPAFDTITGMPYGTVNLKYGVPVNETPITCTAGIGTFIIEFGTLSRLTGNPIFEKVAMRSLISLWKYRSELGLFGNHIDVLTGKWTASDSGIGAGVDSYFEYLMKGSMLFHEPHLFSMFQESNAIVEKYLRYEDWYIWASMTKAQVTMPVFHSLEAFWPGLLSLLGDIDKAMKSIHNYHKIWKRYGFIPDVYYIPVHNIVNGKAAYPLRPELAESLMYLFRATKDPWLLSVGEDMVRSIQHSAKTSCGYATVKDIRNHHLENRMESFFLAETTKYLYLLFDPNNFIHNSGNVGSVINSNDLQCIVDAGGYVFNTEAHPIDPAALSCCSVNFKYKKNIENHINTILNTKTIHSENSHVLSFDFDYSAKNKKCFNSSNSFSNENKLKSEGVSGIKSHLNLHKDFLEVTRSKLVQESLLFYSSEVRNHNESFVFPKFVTKILSFVNTSDYQTFLNFSHKEMYCNTRPFFRYFYIQGEFHEYENI